MFFYPHYMYISTFVGILCCIILSIFSDFKMSITDEQKQIIKSTAPILKENGKEITSIFYKNLFQANPELLNLFNQTNQKLVHSH